MPLGSRIKTGDLADRLAALDIDEGIRIENVGGKMFVNRNASGTFVIQFGSDFQYLDSEKQVISLMKSKFGKKCAVWAY
jgi:hypothetical protein